MFYEVLDESRQELLPLFSRFKGRFYLAGGTALALQLGHRESFDFDFFSAEQFNPAALLTELEQLFNPRKLTAVQEEKNTLTVIVGSGVRLSFFYYPYPLLSAVADDGNIRLASLADIGCMKLAAIVSRNVNKDYVDAYYILREITLGDALNLAAKKLPALDRNLILKSLVYFRDLEIEPLKFLPGKEVDMATVEKFLITEVKKLGLS